MALSPTLELFLSKLTLYLWMKLHRFDDTWRQILGGSVLVSVFFKHSSTSRELKIRRWPSLLKLWNFHSWMRKVTACQDVDTDTVAYLMRHLYYNTQVSWRGRVRKGLNVKNCLSYVHTAVCWHAACFDLCFQRAKTSSLSLRPTHLSISTAGLVSSVHTQKCFKNALTLYLMCFPNNF